MALIPYFARIQFEFGARRLLAEELQTLGVRSPLVITDAGVRASGVLALALESLSDPPPEVFDGVAPDPNFAVVSAAAARYRAAKCDGIKRREVRGPAPAYTDLDF